MATIHGFGLGQDNNCTARAIRGLSAATWALQSFSLEVGMKQKHLKLFKPTVIQRIYG